MSQTLPSDALDQGPSDAPATRHKLGWGMFVVLLAQLMLVLDATVINVALTDIQTDLGFSPAGLSWVLDGFMLAFGGLLLLGGRLGDVFGRRRTFWWGLLVFTLASLVGGLAPSAATLVIARVAQGVGAAMASPSVLALLTTSAPDEHARHRALAAFAAVSSGGGALGMLLGGVLTDVLSWRWTLFINVPIGLAVLLTVTRLVKETPRRSGRFDVAGAITATLGAVAIVWAFVEAPEAGWTSARFLGGLAFGLLMMAVLAVTETRVQHPLLRLDLLRSRERASALVVMAFGFGGLMGLWYVVILFLEQHLGFSPLAAGFAFLPWPVGVFTMSRLTPTLVRRFGRIRLLVTGLALMTAGLLWLTQLDAGSHYFWAVFPTILLGGVGGGLYFMPLTATVMNAVPNEHAGAASGLLQTMQQLGGAIGLAVVASVFASHQAQGFASGTHAGVIASTLLVVAALAVALSIWLRPRAQTAA